MQKSGDFCRLFFVLTFYSGVLGVGSPRHSPVHVVVMSSEISWQSWSLRLQPRTLRSPCKDILSKYFVVLMEVINHLTPCYLRESAYLHVAATLLPMVSTDF